MEDPDDSARGFVHRVVYGIPPGTKGLAEGSLPSAAEQGANGAEPQPMAGTVPPGGKRPEAAASQHCVFRCRRPPTAATDEGTDLTLY